MHLQICRVTVKFQVKFSVSCQYTFIATSNFKTRLTKTIMKVMMGWYRLKIVFCFVRNQINIQFYLDQSSVRAKTRTSLASQSRTARLQELVNCQIMTNSFTERTYIREWL